MFQVAGAIRCGHSVRSIRAPHRPRRPFHIVAKAVGSACNLRCGYCYYLHKQDLLPVTRGQRLSDELRELFVRQYIAGQERGRVRFNWHCGEPTFDQVCRAARLMQRR
ncbi:MAG: hypothetical protein ACOY3P_05365 [Planctomycetota bacterium]